MSQKLTIRAFFFNAKTDYLPYYKNFTLFVDTDTKAKDLLMQIQEANENFSFPKQKLLMKINGLVVEDKESMSKIVEKLGTELQIDPVSSYRSNDGLKINDDDFMESYALLEPYATEADLKYYKTLYALHYASETENFDRDYIGDAVLVLAHKMISEGNENKEEILTAITTAHSGLLDCEYENNLLNAQDHTASINELKAMLIDDVEERQSFFELIKSTFLPHKEDKELPEKKHKIIEDLGEKQIAYYPALSSDKKKIISQMILDMGAKEVAFKRVHKLSGLDILEYNKTLAFKKAGTTLLDAYDSGAEVLVVENTDLLDMFTQNHKAIEKTLGREIIGLELLSSEDFILQASSIAS